ncbi:MAG TPA: class I SAM-dependent methyltransferase [Mucilaginibacter sp.]|nr:class I SAM-dependent methyltransferase [Mucilaginibacter sp.]
MIKIHPAADRVHPKGSADNSVFNDTFLKEDAAFDWLYPEHIEAKSRKHWSPLAVTRNAARFLAEPDARVLDIGSGVGKFCLAAAHYYPDTFFFGVEQRHELVLYAEEAKSHLQLPNVHFIFANMTQINFSEFDHFYFYNAFYENIDDDDPIDDSIEKSYNLYQYYTQYLRTALELRPRGTRLVTYHSLEEEIPASYVPVDACCNTLLKMWIKR